jgi:hypothetical protein
MPMRRRSTAPCKLLPPEKMSKALRSGDFTRGRIVGTQGHDLSWRSDLNAEKDKAGNAGL